MAGQAAPDLWALESWVTPGNILTMLGIAVALYIFGHKLIDGQLNDAKDRADIKRQLQAQTAFDAYQARLRGLNRRLDDFFGSAKGYLAFDRCLSIAFLYPIFLFVMAWIGGAGGTLATLRVLPDLGSLPDRLFYAVLLAGLGGVWFLLLRNLDRLGNPVERVLWWLARLDEATAPLMTRRIIKGAAFAGFVAFAVAFAGAVAFAFAFAPAGVGVGAVVVGFAFAVAFAAAAAAADGVAFAFVIALFVFYVGLPVLNALLDFASWGVTRFFLNRIASHESGRRVWLWLALELVLDLAAAVGFLVFLAVLLPFAISLANLAFSAAGLPTVNWRAHLDAAEQAPFPKGVLVIGMLMTTLIPTALHLTIGLAALPTAFHRSARDLAGYIPDHPAPIEPASKRQEIVHELLYRRVWLLPAAFVTAGFFALLAYLFAISFEPFWELLVSLARWSGSLVG